jgi:ribosomal protein L34E
LGRQKVLIGACILLDCGRPLESRVYCQSHARAWNRKYGGDRCDWLGCKVIIATDAWDQPRRKDGSLLKVDGRTMDTGTGRKSYCRLHEPEHLRPSAAIEELNWKRLGDGLELHGECWIPRGHLPSLSNGAATFDPEGSNGKVHWPYHRAVWDLLMGGHGQRQELDHLTGCLVGARCANPAHLQPVTRAENMARRRQRNLARKMSRPFGPKTCGPAVNRLAVTSPEVQKFAVAYGLTLPIL